MFDKAVEVWIEQGILVPWDKAEHGNVKTFLPLMSVRQMKGTEEKVRPVLDFRSLNKNIVCLPGEMPACEAKLREWRRAGANCSVVDLKRAYLQIFVAKEFWAYQAVRWKGQVYLLTRLGFGLNVAPKIMTAIVQKVLNVNKKMKASASSYLNDILVKGERTEIEEVREHLHRYGL